MFRKLKLLRKCWIRKLNGAFWCYLKRCFGSWNCWENIETKEAKWCIRTTFRGGIECGILIITEITLNKTIRYNVKLLIYYFQHSLFEHTGVFANFKNMTYSLNCISVLLYVHSGFTLFGLLLWGYFPGRHSKY